MQWCPPVTAGITTFWVPCRSAGFASFDGIGECLLHRIWLQPELFEVEHETVRQRGDAFATLTERFAVRRFVGDERAGSSPSVDRPGLFELAVGASDGARREVEVLGEVSHRRQPTAGLVFS